MATAHPAAAPHVLDPDHAANAVNREQDPAAALPDPEDAGHPDNRLHACWPGVPGNVIDAADDAFLSRLAARAEVVACPPAPGDPAVDACFSLERDSRPDVSARTNWQHALSGRLFVIQEQSCPALSR
jgi:hypothetical protein